MIRAAFGVFRSPPTPSGCWEVRAPPPRPTSSPNSIRRLALSLLVVPGTEISLAALPLPTWPDASLPSPPTARNSLDEMEVPRALRHWRPAVLLAAKRAPPWILAPPCKQSSSCGPAPALRLYFSSVNQNPEKKRATCSIAIERQI